MSTVKDITYTPYSMVQTVMSTELDGGNFNNDDRVISTLTIDNTALGDFRDDLELYITFDMPPSDGANVEIYLLPLFLGGLPSAGNYDNDDFPIYIGKFLVQPWTMPQRLFVRHILINPGQFHYMLHNMTGVNAVGTVNTLRRASYNTKSPVPNEFYSY